jgi:hypothetical protein
VQNVPGQRRRATAAPAAALHAALEAGGLVGQLLAGVERLVELALLLRRHLPRPLARAACGAERERDQQHSQRRTHGAEYTPRLRHPEEVR